MHSQIWSAPREQGYAAIISILLLEKSEIT